VVEMHVRARRAHEGWRQTEDAAGWLREQGAVHASDASAPLPFDTAEDEAREVETLCSLVGPAVRRGGHVTSRGGRSVVEGE
jgi:hypothetical protein